MPLRIDIKIYKIPIFSKNPTSCATAATTSRGGMVGRGSGGVSLSEQILQGAANAKRHSPQSSSASSEGNDDAAMAVIMSLLEVRFIDIYPLLLRSVCIRVILDTDAIYLFPWELI